MENALDCRNDAEAAHGGPCVQKFGRIEAIRSHRRGAEIDIRRPDGGQIIALIDAAGDRGRSLEADLGRNIWVFGWITGDRMRVEDYEILADER